ncbi:MAG: ABC-F family ATP-binding cassette domain-containing protein [Aphanocapsa lilacina HA4352-LM1]|jgi:ATP-binding cassette subfamily F protein uup|nr:ABC-F family ATP-binding cassette domain-containing protein [Aphanocapsa lilacina HA4352-LM1]
MGLISLQSVRKSLGLKVLLEGATFSLETGDKVGLIGTNGSGKSTLLKILARLEAVDAGQIQTGHGARVVYLPQQPELDPERTVIEQVFADSGERMDLVREYEQLVAKLTHHPDDPALNARLAALMQRMETGGAWELETQAKIVLTKLGIADFEARVGTLSGGYRRRIALATALLAEPDVLLLDEPTNHLDALSVEWLQSYLGRFRGALVLVTHDRYFLDKVTGRILELDRGALTTYSGNYAYYLEKKALAEDAEASSQRKHRGVLRRELEWLKRGPKARSTKQKARIERARALQEQPFRQAKGKVEIATPGRRLGSKVIELENVSKAHNGRTLIDRFSYKFTPEDRIGIIGGNGAGKSTLMDIITGRQSADAGTVEIGSTVHIGYFDQHSEALLAAMDDNQRVIDYIKAVGELVKLEGGAVITASQMLERFLFAPNQQYVPLEQLSGGEKRRLFLLRELMAAPNVLILDEPTNDLDVPTLAVLEEYLEDFNGCVIAVSHDRYFLDRVVDTIFAFEENGLIRQYPGNYSIYLEHKKAEEDTQAATAKFAKPAPAAKPKSSEIPSPDRPRKLSSKEKRELQTLEAKIAQMEDERTQLEQSLGSADPGDFTQANAVYERMGELTRHLDEATERWMSLAELDS